MLDYQEDFIRYALDCGVLKFGEFKLKSGRASPYFFNTGLFNSGAQLGNLGRFYARALRQSGLTPDILYGPAYKGIPLVSATAIAFAQLQGSDIPFAFNRKEVKDHGEGGNLVGAPLQGKVLIVDDVITAGTSVRESLDVIRNAGATPYAVLIALDRQEKGRHEMSAVQEVVQAYALPVVAIITLADVIAFLQTRPGERHNLAAVEEYRRIHGI